MDSIQNAQSKDAAFAAQQRQLAMVKRVARYISFNGDFSLTPKWKTGLNSGFGMTGSRF